MEENKTTLPLNNAYPFGIEQGLEQAIEAIRNMAVKWDSSYTSSVRRGYIIELFEKYNIYEEFKTLYWPYGNTSYGESKRKRYLRIKNQYDDFLTGRSPEMKAPEAHKDSEGVLPERVNVEYAESMLRRTSQEVVSLDAVLDQIEQNFKKDGKPLKANWRHITKRNIELWFGNQR